MRKLAIVAAMSACLSGCMSVMCHTAGETWSCPYAGTAMALEYAGSVPLLYADAVLDVVLDTALLPFDLLMMQFRRSADR